MFLIKPPVIIFTWEKKNKYSTSSSSGLNCSKCVKGSWQYFEIIIINLAENSFIIKYNFNKIKYD